MRQGRLLTIVLFVILSCSWLSVTPAAWAQHGEKAGATKVEHEEELGGPQIFTPVRIDLAIWTLVVFLLLLFVLSKYAWNPMLDALHKREGNIRSAIDEAQRAREEARQIQDMLAGERAKIAEETRVALDAARRHGQELRDTMLTQAKADIQTERDRLHREIHTARDQALKQLWEQAAQLATLISAKAIRRQLTPEDHRRLVDEALADLQGARRDRLG